MVRIIMTRTMYRTNESPECTLHTNSSNLPWSNLFFLWPNQEVFFCAVLSTVFFKGNSAIQPRIILPFCTVLEQQTIPQVSSHSLFNCGLVSLLSRRQIRTRLLSSLRVDIFGLPDRSVFNAPRFFQPCYGL